MPKQNKHTAALKILSEEYGLDGDYIKDSQLYDIFMSALKWKEEQNPVLELIAKERKEQIEVHHRTIEHDVESNSDQQLRMGAYALLKIDIPEGDEIGLNEIGEFPANWNDDACVKMSNKPYKERLIIAAALIVAELDRIEHLTK